MAFLVQPGQFVNLVFTAPYAPDRPDYLKYVFTPAQTIQGFPLEFLASQFPTGFSNTAEFPAYFDVDEFIFVPPPWNPGGWQKAIHKTVINPKPNVYAYSWAPAGFGVTATLS